jgi:hypothetical protein
MIRLKDLLSEKVTDVKWVSKAYKHAATKKFPFTPKISKILNDGKRVNAFHITSVQKLNQLDSIQGTKKSISCMTRVPNEATKLSINGVWNHGVMFYVEGTLMIQGNDDIMSEPDEQGRRWVGFESNLHLDWWEFINDDSKLRKISDDMGDDAVTFARNNSDNKNRGELLRKYIERYVQLAEQFAQSHKQDIIDEFNRNQYSSWDELLLNDIKLIDVIWGKYSSQPFLHIMSNKNKIDEVSKKLESMVSGKVIITADDSEIKSFVNSRKAKMKK